MEIQRKDMIQAVNDKMFTEMKEQGKKLGLRYFSTIIGVSLGTLARFINHDSDNIELKTLELICKWLDKPLTDFYK